MQNYNNLLYINYLCKVSLLDNKNIKKTPISSMGEFGLIDHLTNQVILRNKSTIKGVGDDTAVINNGNR